MDPPRKKTLIGGDMENDADTLDRDYSQDIMNQRAIDSNAGLGTQTRPYFDCTYDCTFLLILSVH